VKKEEIENGGKVGKEVREGERERGREKRRSGHDEIYSGPPE